MRIVIIDDDPTDRWIMLRELKRLLPDVLISECDNVMSAIDAVRSDQPDVVLLDIQMPEISGLEGYGQIRDASARPVIYFLSSSSSNQDKNTACELGANGYFVKPSSISGFADLASDILKLVA